MPDTSVASLVKFCSVDTALKILNSGALRWSAPHLFEDPFELSHTSSQDFDAGSLLDALVRQVIAQLFGPEPPSPGHSRLRLTIRRWREEQRFASEEEALQVLQGLLRQLADTHFRLVDHYLADWRRFAREVRIACFSDRATNVAAWARFGDNHRGVALRFECGSDTSLGLPRRVHYGQQPPTLLQLREQLEVIFDQRPPPDTGEFRDKLLAKSRLNEREAEWRCLRMESQGDDACDERLWYSDHPFDPGELLGVYFGVTTPRNDREDLLRVLQERYPATAIYDCEVVPGRYEITSTRLGVR